MAKDKPSNKGKERIVNWALLVQQKIDSKGIHYHIKSQNQGISDAEIILIVEAWLDKVKQKYKDVMMSGLKFKDK